MIKTFRSAARKRVLPGRLWLLACLIALATGLFAENWVGEIVWAISGVMGAVFLRPIAQAAPEAIPGTGMDLFHLGAGHRLGSIGFAAFQWLLLCAPGIFFLLTGSYGLAMAILGPACALFIHQLLRIGQPWKFKLLLTDAALRLVVEEPLDFVFADLLHARRDRDLWLLTARDGRAEWVDATWTGAASEAFHLALRRRLKDAGVRVVE